MEGQAEAGGICISGTVYDQVENKLDLGYEFIGDQTVKNITKPVRVYQVVMEPVTASLPAMANDALELPEKPSIAVLPFVNMSGDPEQEYFSDGMTEDLITDLSKISGLFIISRNSVFTYKGKAVKVQQVAEDLGVRYVVEGSVRKAGERVRINAQLIDATTGYHLWAERYDGDLKDVFDLQDEVTEKIVASLEVQLTEGEKEHLERAPTDNLEAYDYFLRGMEFFRRANREANDQARQMFERAIELAPEFADAYAYLALTYFQEWTAQWSQDPQTLEQAFELAQRAVALDDSLPTAHEVLGNVYLWKKQHEQAIAEAEKAIALDPNDANSYAWLGNILNFAGKPEEAIGLVEKAMRLNPHDPFVYSYTLGHAFYLMGRYEKAIAAFKRTLIRNPNFFPSHALLAIIYSELGREGEAQAEVAEILSASPDYSLKDLMRMPYKDQAVQKRNMDALRKAGLPE